MNGKGYGKTLVFLHGLIAVSIFFLFFSSWWMLGLPLASTEFTFRELPFQLHKNIGITLVFMLGLLLYLRLKYRQSNLRSDMMKPLMQKLSFINHVMIYILILSVCISGYLSSASTPWDTTLWWLVDLPRIFQPDEELNELFSGIHIWTSWALLAVITAHLGGALYHAFRNDGIIKRMLRW
jgi:cytochrome b561